MKKRIDLLKIEGVKFEGICENITKDNVDKFIKDFRKKGRPTYEYINALITINRLQNKCSRYIEEMHEKVAEAQKRTRQAQEIHVLYWVVAIALMIVFAVGFWTIVAFICSKIV